MAFIFNVFTKLNQLLLKPKKDNQHKNSNNKNFACYKWCTVNNKYIQRNIKSNFTACKRLLKNAKTMIKSLLFPSQLSSDFFNRDIEFSTKVSTTLMFLVKFYICVKDGKIHAGRRNESKDLHKKLISFCEFSSDFGSELKNWSNIFCSLYIKDGDFKSNSDILAYDGKFEGFDNLEDDEHVGVDVSVDQAVDGLFDYVQANGLTNFVDNGVIESSVNGLIVLADIHTDRLNDVAAVGQHNFTVDELTGVHFDEPAADGFTGVQFNEPATDELSAVQPDEPVVQCIHGIMNSEIVENSRIRLANEELSPCFKTPATSRLQFVKTITQDHLDLGNFILPFEQLEKKQSNYTQITNEAFTEELSSNNETTNTFIHNYDFFNIPEAHYNSDIKDFQNSQVGECGTSAINIASNLKFDPERHMPWRHEILAFPYTQFSLDVITHSTISRNNLYCFMQYETFRIVSFNMSDFPTELNVLVVNLAKDGFYYQRSEIVCFGCGNKSTELKLTYEEYSHYPECPRDESNVPLSQMFNGLNPRDLAEYYKRYRSLTPFLHEFLQQPEDTFEMSNSAVQSGRNSEATDFTSNTFTSSGYSSNFPHTRSPGTECSDSSESIISQPDRDYPSNYVKEVSQKYSNEDYLKNSILNQSAAASPIVIAEEFQEPEVSNQILTLTGKHSQIKSEMFHQARSWDANEKDRGASACPSPSLDLSNAVCPDYAEETERLKTFHTWSPTYKHQPDDLVVNGFFYLGHEDCVKCFYCGLELKSLKPTDILAYEHAKYSPDCLYIIGYKGQDYINRVLQDITDEQESTYNDRTVAFSMVNSNLPDQPEEAISSDWTGTTDSRQNNYIDSEAAQEALRRGWSSYQVWSAVKHIVEVYGYSCLEIELLLDVLSNFNMAVNRSRSLIDSHPTNTNEPIFDEMADSLLQTSGHSSNILGLPGAYGTNLEQPPAIESEVINATEAERPTTPLVNISEARRPTTPIVNYPEARRPTTLDFNSTEILQSVEREHTLLADRVTCKLCHSKPVSSIYLPCGHVIACHECAEAATRCLYCYKQIVGTANIFMS